MFDVLILGPMTRDVIRIGDEPARSQAGGVPIYAGLALAVLGFRVGVVTRLAEHDRAALTAPLAAAGVEVRCGPSEATTVFENIYAEGAESPRRQRLAAIAEPIAAADLAGLSARIVLLGPLTRGDLTADVVAAAREAGDIVALDGQGLTRQRVRGTIRAAKPSGQGHELSTAHILKVNGAEARTFSGIEDAGEAARALAHQGPDDVIVTLGADGAVVLAEGAVLRIAAKPYPRIVDRTGCGDTYFAGYLAARLQGQSVRDAAGFAAELARRKLARQGPLQADDIDMALAGAGAGE